MWRNHTSMALISHTAFSLKLQKPTPHSWHSDHWMKTSLDLSARTSHLHMHNFSRCHCCFIWNKLPQNPINANENIFYYQFITHWNFILNPNARMVLCTTISGGSHCSSVWISNAKFPCMWMSIFVEKWLIDIHTNYPSIHATWFRFC